MTQLDPHCQAILEEYRDNLQKILDMTHADFLESLDGNRLVQAEYHTAQVKHHMHFLLVVFLHHDELC